MNGNKSTKLMATDRLLYSQGEHPHQIMVIVTHLMQILHILDGNHLALSFGYGQETGNRKVLMKWVEQDLDKIDLDETERRLRNLANITGQTIES